MSKWRLLGTGLTYIILMLVMVACGAPTATGTPGVPGTPSVRPDGEPTQTMVTATVASTARPTDPVDREVSPSPTQVIEEPTKVTETAIPTETAAAGPAQPPVDLTNPFPKILGPTPAPEGWNVQPCPGDAPFLCVSEGVQNIGFVNLSSYPLQTLPEFQKMLSDAGVDAEAFDYKNPEDAAKARQALTAFVENFHTTIRQDREATFGKTKTYKRLETEEINIGGLPGLRYGLTILNQDGSVFERWLHFSAFDGEGLFTIVAPFYPNPEQSFRSDRDLQEFEPFLVEIIKGLQLPHPEVRGDKFRG